MLVGHIDLVVHDCVYGWVHDDERPDLTIDVELYIDGKSVSQGLANLYRSDLQVASIGSGYHGFCLEIPMYIRDGSSHHFEIRPADRGGDIVRDGTLDVIIPARKNSETGLETEEIISLIFDAEYYVRQAGPTEKPLDHYRKIGWKLGYDPHVLFSTEYYLENIGRDLDSDPLSDFCAFGTVVWPEVHPLLDVKEYLRIRPDLISHNLHPLTHYLRYGHEEDVDTFRIFDSAFYRTQVSCDDDGEVGGPIHYLKSGWKDGKRPHPQFDPATFSKLAMLPEEREPLSHLLSECLRWKRLALAGASRPDSPDTSIVILNLDKSLVSLQCLYFVQKFTDRKSVEVIVFDNGSRGDQFELLIRYGINCKILRVQNNLGFGEGNNIAVEAALGENIVFLNNDTFVTPGWIGSLLSQIEDRTVGSAGPIFLYPNGSVQEAGGFIFDDGIVHQRGRGLPAFDANYDRRENVDYISAAALAIRKDVFLDVLGFDLMWDPAYYEDVDLCLKLKAEGYRVVFEPKSKVVHLEGTTSLDSNLRLNNLVSTNRLKFIQRWKKTIQEGVYPRKSSFDLTGYRPLDFRGKPTLALYTPYPLQPGGGERYILSIAYALKDKFDCVLFMPRVTSRIRLLTMAREFGLNLDHVKCEIWSERGSYNQPDLFFCVGNEVVPSVEAIGRQNYFICQFPFPAGAEKIASNWHNGVRYDGVILYSTFAVDSFIEESRKFGLQPLPVHRVYPPVDLISGEDARGDVKRILSVGRFGPDGHCKRQDVMIEVFKEICQYEERPMELHLAGSIGPDDRAREYLFELRRISEGLRVFFHVNISAKDLQDLYLQSDIYWHMTGANDSFHLNPERFEHFGITIVEAMSAGCIPIVIGRGGPAEIVEDKVSGFHVSDKGALVRSTMSVLEMPPDKIASYRSAAIERAQRYSYEKFSESLQAVIGS